LSAQDYAAQEVNQEHELEKLGENAQERIKTVEGFMKNNLDPETYEQARNLVTNADTIALVEMLVQATAPAKLPMDGGHNPQGLSWEAIETEMFKKDEQGNLLRSTNIEHERKIQKMMEAWGGSGN
jgi:folylpolyglutamate synthase/dihydropteroate synthase